MSFISTAYMELFFISLSFILRIRHIKMQVDVIGQDGACSFIFVNFCSVLKEQQNDITVVYLLLSVMYQ
uniref:Uncharacterized protein n=1 Tax=Anguilla anguilla TaxID=7936 RepID=A0A0E9X241_ANGAN